MDRRKRFRFYSLKLCGIIFVVFLIQLFVSGFTDLFLLNDKAPSQLWRFVTPIFLHGGFAHLLYNAFALALFGSMLERIIGSRRFLLVFFISGILANIVSVNFYDSSLGASGAIFGIIGSLIVIRPLMMIFAFGFPMPIFIAGIVWALGDLIGFFYSTSGNTANIAHLSGMFLGLILGFVYRKKALRGIG
ncbi:rhomboid family intramembrane serine protease [Candidatus Pacearchaeota archaeon]|nr:rhomboid family intramembrane serine protease [Candidatus Pacearchaeota archaeon]